MWHGHDLRGQDYTKAVVRAVRDALWHNSLTCCGGARQDPSEMIALQSNSVARPDLVDRDEVAKVFPYGDITVTAEKGATDQAMPTLGGVTTIAIAGSAGLADAFRFFALQPLHQARR
ncbi:MAG: Lin0512 family protein [Nitratireductor sp.]